MFIPEFPHWKTICIVGKPGQGKTVLAIIMLAQQNRKIIIIDPKDEYSEISRPNMISLTNSISVPHITLSDFTLPLSAFTQPSDWASLGFADKGSQRLARWAGWRNIHRDNPERFELFLERLPIDYRALNGFNEDPLNNDGIPLPEPLPAPINERTKNAMLDQFSIMKYVFQGRPGQRIEKIAFREMFKKNDVIRIHVGAFVNEHELAKGRAMVAKLLEWLSDSKGWLLKKYKPAIYIDEADKLCPSKTPFDALLSSSIQFKNYVLKYRAYGVQMVFAFQSIGEFDRAIWENAHYRILGKIDEWTPWITTTSNLQWLPDKGIRQFALIHPNGWADRFNPLPCPTQHGGYKYDLEREKFIYKYPLSA